MILHLVIMSSYTSLGMTVSQTFLVFDDDSFPEDWPGFSQNVSQLRFV